MSDDHTTSPRPQLMALDAIETLSFQVSNLKADLAMVKQRVSALELRFGLAEEGVARMISVLDDILANPPLPRSRRR